jgi:alkylhydroperoxidase/carboxymuconolactone decarboxylase family protein YurZ
MTVRRCRHSAFLAAVVAAALIGPDFSSTAFAGDLRCAPQDAAADTPDSTQPLLAKLRTECPLLGGIVEEFVWQDLGEAFPGEGRYSHVSEMAVVAAFAASGDIASMLRHAHVAREAGATAREFKKLLYLTVVNAGALKGIDAARALSDFLDARDDQCLHRSTRSTLQQF